MLIVMIAVDDYDDEVTSVDDEAGFDAGEVYSSAAAKGKRAAFQVDYQPLSKTDLAKEMKKEIDHVAGALDLKVRLDASVIELAVCVS